MRTTKDQKIINSWRKNVSAWARAIQLNRIPSRVLVTDDAVVTAVMAFSPEHVLDVGCGEGWLARALSRNGVVVTGVDAISGLIDDARQQGGGDFHVCCYEDLTPDTLDRRFDVVVCNFSLLGHESVSHLFDVIPTLLNDGGHFIVQTLHPKAHSGQAPYVDGWREGSWEGFSDDFVDPAPWYFRTVESWIDLYQSNGFVCVDAKDITYPQSGALVSLLLVGEVGR